MGDIEALLMGGSNQGMKLPTPKGRDFAIGKKFLSGLQGLRQNISAASTPIATKDLIPAAKGALKASPAARSVPLFAIIDAAMELTDRSDPFQKNLAESLGSVGGSLGGAAAGATIFGAPGALIGALLMSPVGKQLASGAYRAINPRGEVDYAIKQLDKQAEVERARQAINRQIAMDVAKDAQRLEFENQMVQSLLR